MSLKRLPKDFLSRRAVFWFFRLLSQRLWLSSGKNLAIHSNVGGVLIISLGCENFDRRRLEQEVRESGRPCHTLVIQENKGTTNTITLGKQLVAEMLEQLADTPRCILNWSDRWLVLSAVARWHQWYHG